MKATPPIRRACAVTSVLTSNASAQARTRDETTNARTKRIGDSTAKGPMNREYSARCPVAANATAIPNQTIAKPHIVRLTASVGGLSTGSYVVLSCLVMGLLLSCRVLAGSEALAADGVATGLVRGAFEHRRRRVEGHSPPEALAERPQKAGKARLRGLQSAARPRGFEKLLLARVSDLIEKEIHPSAHGCISLVSHPPPSAL